MRRPNRHRTLKQRTDQHISDQTRLVWSKTDRFAELFFRCLLFSRFQVFSCLRIFQVIVVDKCKGMSPVDPVAFFSTRFSWGPTFAFVNTFVNATHRETKDTLETGIHETVRTNRILNTWKVEKMANLHKVGNHEHFKHQRTKRKAPNR